MPVVETEAVCQCLNLAWLRRIMFLLSYLAAMTAILLLWFVYPKVFDYSEATQDSLLFMDAMKVSIA